jgi:hypothetical protein
MRSKPVEMEKLPHVSLMNASGFNPNLYTNKTEGKGIGTSVFDFSGRAEQKATVISLKEQSKQDKQRDAERGRANKRQKAKRRHTNRILKKATKKLMKSKGELLFVCKYVLCCCHRNIGAVFDYPN